MDRSVLLVGLGGGVRFCVCPFSMESFPKATLNRCPDFSPAAAAVDGLASASESSTDEVARGGPCDDFVVDVTTDPSALRRLPSN